MITYARMRGAERYRLLLDALARHLARQRGTGARVVPRRLLRDMGAADNPVHATVVISDVMEWFAEVTDAAGRPWRLVRVERGQHRTAFFYARVPAAPNPGSRVHLPSLPLFLFSLK